MNIVFNGIYFTILLHLVTTISCQVDEHNSKWNHYLNVNAIQSRLFKKILDLNQENII